MLFFDLESKQWLDDDLSDYDDAMALDKEIWASEQNNLNGEY